MKTCTDCKYAEWKRTAAGKLHPSGDGQCRYPWKMPELPVAFHWMGSGGPKPFGGRIYRKRENKEHCAYWSRA
jgi:hypothetical protein